MIHSIIAYLTVWSPFSTGFLITYILMLLGMCVILIRNKDVVAAWLDARRKEQSTQHGYNVAITTTSYWLLDLAGMLPQGEHISFRLVEVGWIGALALFIYPSSAAKLSGVGGSSSTPTKQ